MSYLETEHRGSEFYPADIAGFTAEKDTHKETALPPAEQLAQVTALLKESQFDVARADSKFMARMEVFARDTHILEDEIRAGAYAARVQEYMETQVPDKTMSDDELRVIQLASVLTDIGKLGPYNASPEQTELLRQMYNYDAGLNTAMSVETFLQTCLAMQNTDERQAALRVLEGLGVTANTTMREFYNLHVVWSLDVAEKSGLPHDPMILAAAHHLLEYNIPKNIVDLQTGYFNPESSGLTGPITRAEVLVELLDKYDAFLHRDQQHTHDEAIAYLRRRTAIGAGSPLDTMPDFARALYTEAIHDLDHALKAPQRRAMPAAA